MCWVVRIKYAKFSCRYENIHNSYEFVGHVGCPLPCAKVKLVDVPEMDYYAEDGKGEVSNDNTFHDTVLDISVFNSLTVFQRIFGTMIFITLYHDYKNSTSRGDNTLIKIVMKGKYRNV